MPCYTLPYAEPVLAEKDTVVKDPWINDLDAFPPLSPRTLVRSRQPSASSTAAASIGSNSWEIITPEVEVSSTQDHGWEVIIDNSKRHRTEPSFAHVAEAAGMYHDPIPTHGPFLFGRLQHFQHKKRSPPEVGDDDDDDEKARGAYINSDNDNDLISSLYDQHKSQARIAARRVPYIHRQRQRIQETVLRRDMRQSLPQAHERYARRLAEAQDAMATTCAKQAEAQQNWRSALLLERPKVPQGMVPTADDSTRPPPTTTPVYYVPSKSSRRRRSGKDTKPRRVWHMPICPPNEYLAFHHIVEHELKRRPEVGRIFGYDVSSKIVSFFGRNTSLPFYEFRERLIPYVQGWPYWWSVFPDHVPYDDQCAYQREQARIVREELKPKAHIAFYPVGWIVCCRLLSGFYLYDMLELKRKYERLELMLDDILSNDAPKALYKAIGKGGFASSRDKQLRKRLVQHFLEQWKRT